MDRNSAIPAHAVSRLLDRLADSGLTMHGFTLTQGGETAAEGYWAPFRAAMPHRMFSVSKSLTSLAVGLLAADGKLKLTDAICDYFPDKLPQHTPGPLRRLTLRDMLRMATCHRQTAYKLTDDPDWTRSFFTVPPTHEPGTVFNYDTGASHTLAALAERVTGMPLVQFLQSRLLNSIGAMDEKRWLTDPVGVSQGGTGLVMTLRDLTRVAQFCMEGGAGTPLEAYLSEATCRQIDTSLQDGAEERFGYGYQFWRIRNGGFALYGLGGQLALCLPQRHAVFCTVADTQLDPGGVQAIHNAFWDTIYPWLGKETPSPQGERDALRERLGTLYLAPVKNQAAYRGGYGQAYVLEENPTGMRAVRPNERELCFETDTGRHTLPFGVGEWAGSVFPDTQEPCIASGGWIAPGLFRLDCHLTGDHPCGMLILLFLRDGRVTVQIKAVRDSVTAQYAGIASGRMAGRG